MELPDPAAAAVMDRHDLWGVPPSQLPRKITELDLELTELERSELQQALAH